MLLRACWEQGWWCEQRRTGIIWAYPPNPELDGVVFHLSPRGARSYENQVALLRQRGLML